MKKDEIVKLLANALEMRRHVDEEIANMTIVINEMRVFIRELSSRVTMIQRKRVLHFK